MRCTLFGLPLDVQPLAATLERVREAVRGNRGLTVGYLNVHVVEQALQNSRLRDALHGTDLIYCDGFGVKLAATALYGVPVERSTALDFLPAFLAELCAAGLGLGFIGGKREVSAAGIERLRRLYPGLALQYLADGYSDAVDEASLAEKATKLELRLLLCGLGTPRQELLCSRLKSLLPTTVLWSVGGLLDYFGGAATMPSRRISAYGGEWALRLLDRPFALGPRYLVDNPRFASRLIVELLRRRVSR